MSPDFADTDTIIRGARMALDVGTASGPDSNHTKLASLVRQLKTRGKQSISNRRLTFDRADKLYRAYRTADNDDKKASEAGEPIKIYYPIAFAQVQTYIATLMALFERTPFFQLSARQPSQVLAQELMELDLQYQLDRNNWPLTLHQILLDKVRYGFGGCDVGFWQQKVWVRENVRGMKRMMAQLLGMPTSQDTLITAYEGNVIQAIDPYNMMWDTEVSVGDLQKGRFVFSSSKYLPYNELRMRAETKTDVFPNGEFFNIGSIPKLDRVVSEADTARQGREINNTFSQNPIEGGNLVLLDECYVKLVPADYGLSPLQQEQIWQVVLANESRIIKAEPSRFEHGKFPILTAEYSPDFHADINDGLVQTIDGMQEIINWLLNARISNVRRVVNNQMVIDDQYLNLDDIESKRPFIRLRKNLNGRDIRTLTNQLLFSDVTQSHVGDATNIFQILQRVSGINDNMMGMQLPTQRSATEVLQLQKLGSARIRLHAQLFFYQLLRPLAEIMVANTQQFASVKRLLRISADKAAAIGLDPGRVANGFVSATPEDIQGMFDVVATDPMSPADKAAQASTLTELLTMLVQAPPMIGLLGARPGMIANRILNLKGIENSGDFIQSPTPLQTAALLAPMMGGPADGSLPPDVASARNGVVSGRSAKAVIKPDEEIMAQVQAGNLRPM